MESGNFKMKLLFVTFEIVGFPKTCFLLSLMKIKGWGGPYRIEETKLVCAISRKLVFD